MNHSHGSAIPGGGERWNRVVQLLASGFAALVAGSRTIPLGDNGSLLRELALRTGRAAPRRL